MRRVTNRLRSRRGWYTRVHPAFTSVGNTRMVTIEDALAGLGFGNTPFHAKLEGDNPYGIKVRAALEVVDRARRRGGATAGKKKRIQDVGTYIREAMDSVRLGHEGGALQPGGRIIESSSGTFGLGLAYVGQQLGHPVTIIADEEIELEVVEELRRRGADVAIVARADADPALVARFRALGATIETVAELSEGGWQRARINVAERMLAEDPAAWRPNQYDNPEITDGYESLAEEILRESPNIDTLVVAVGTGGHSAGLAKYLRQYRPHLRIVAVDATGSVLFGEPATDVKLEHMHGMGSEINPANHHEEIFDTVHWMSADAAVWACRQLKEKYGQDVSGGWSVGAVALAAAWEADNGAGNVVAVFPDRGDRYTTNVYSDDFCDEHGINYRNRPAPPVNVPNLRAQEAPWSRWDRWESMVYSYAPPPMRQPLPRAVRNWAGQRVTQLLSGAKHRL